MAVEVGDNPAAIVPINIKAPVVALMEYIETLFEPEFVTRGNKFTTARNSPRVERGRHY
jgi:hypothetical protein